MSEIFNYRIQHLRGTSDELAEHNIVPLAGEFVIELTGYDENNSPLYKLKIGDGIHKYSELPYFVSDSGDGTGSGVSKEYVDNAIDALEDDVAYLSTHAATKQYVDDAVASSGGGTGGGVLIDTITPDKVIFPNGQMTTYAMGKVTLENGSGVLVPPGGTLQDFFNNFIDEKNPETTQPSVSLIFDQAKAYEVGTKVVPTYVASLNPGSYTYGPDTGITAKSWEITDTAGHSANTASGSFQELQVTDGMNYKITAEATYDAGVIPVTNTGNKYSDGQIKAGSKSTTSGAVTGYRCTFYGTSEGKSDITSNVIRGLAGKSTRALSNGNSFTVTIPVGAFRVIIAYPSTLRDATSIKDVNGMNAEILSSFNKQTVSVEGANAYTAITYKVYILDFANANDTANKFTVTI